MQIEDSINIPVDIFKRKYWLWLTAKRPTVSRQFENSNLNPLNVQRYRVQIWVFSF